MRAHQRSFGLAAARPNSHWGSALRFLSDYVIALLLHTYEDENSTSMQARVSVLRSTKAVAHCPKARDEHFKFEEFFQFDHPISCFRLFRWKALGLQPVPLQQHVAQLVFPSAKHEWGGPPLQMTRKPMGARKTTEARKIRKTQFSSSLVRHRHLRNI